MHDKVSSKSSQPTKGIYISPILFITKSSIVRSEKVFSNLSFVVKSNKSFPLSNRY